MRIRFEYGMGSAADRSYAVREEQFALYSQDGKPYHRPAVVEPKPKLSGRLYPGESLEGWLTFLVSREDQKPLMSFGDNYNRVWFKLY